MRARGQVVAEVAEGGAASKSGLAAGDVIVRLDKVDVFSQDDLATQKYSGQYSATGLS